LDDVIDSNPESAEEFLWRLPLPDRGRKERRRKRGAVSKGSLKRQFQLPPFSTTPPKDLSVFFLRQRERVVCFVFKQYM